MTDQIITTRDALAYELANWHDYGVTLPITFTTWLLGLPVGSLHNYEQISLADCQSVLERLANCDDPELLVEKWLAPAPVLTDAEQGAEWLL